MGEAEWTESSISFLRRLPSNVFETNSRCVDMLQVNCNSIESKDRELCRRETGSLWVVNE